MASIEHLVKITDTTPNKVRSSFQRLRTGILPASSAVARSCRSIGVVDHFVLREIAPQIASKVATPRVGGGN